MNPITAIKDLNRLREILSVLTRHGFGQLVTEIGKTDTFGPILRSLGVTATSARNEDTTPAVRLRLVCQDLGPTFIKFGQILSTRPDLIPPDVANELKNLQDNIPPFSFVHVKEQIESELGKPLSELFETFEEAPLGTASIGQVHAARLKDPTVGSVEDVVVKIQRPQIRGTIESDIDLMRLLAKSLEKRVKQLKTLDLTGILQEFELAIIKELDYSHERRNGTRFYAAFTGNPDVVIPRVYRSHSAKKVLTMQRIKGVKITDAETVGADRRVLARVALRAVLQMVFQNGFFHADPHPGNIFALAGNRVAFLDLGMVGRLSDEMRLHLSDLFIALMQRDTDEIARILCVMGIRQGRVNRASLQRDVIDIMDKVIGVPLEEIQFSEIVKDLMESARRHQIKIPNEYTLMGKALLTVEGVGKNLDPTIDVEAEITPYIRGLIKDRFSPKRLSRDTYRMAMQVSRWTSEFPDHVMTILDDLQSGSLKVRVEQNMQGGTMKNIERVVGKLTAGLIISSLILSSALFLSFSRLDQLIWGMPVTLVLGGLGYIVAAFLGWQVIRAVMAPVTTNEED